MHPVGKPTIQSLYQELRFNFPQPVMLHNAHRLFSTVSMKLLLVCFRLLFYDLVFGCSGL